MIKNIKFKDALDEQLKDEEFKKEWERLEPQYQAITLLMKARIEQQLTQEDLAKKTGIPQSTISKLESGERKPTLNMLQKLANGLGKTLTIDIN